MADTTDYGSEQATGSPWVWSPQDTDRYPAEHSDDPLGQNIATAPGDLPVRQIIERERARRHQFRHDNTIRPLAPVRGEGVEILASAGGELGIESASVFYTTNGTKPDSSSETIPMEVVERDWHVLPLFTDTLRATIPDQPAGTTVRYRIGGWLSESPAAEPEMWAQDGQGFWYRFPAEQGITTFAYRVEEATDPRIPDWVRDGVVYQIFLDRFRTSDPDDRFQETGHRGLHGGTLEGVRRSLGYFRDLGVTCLWLSPLHPAETYHRYDTMDFNAVDPVLGSLDDFKRLTKEGAEHGIRFWMDFVPSHLSWHHPSFLEAQRDKSAATASWFTFYHHPDRYRTFLDLTPFMPSINADDPGARQHLIDSATRWLTEFDVSGFRLDHAIGPSMDFWVAFREATKRARPDSFTVGEATDTPDSLRKYRQRLDAVLDFPLARALRSTFGLRQWDISRFVSFLRAYSLFMATGPRRVSFLDNHDMDRFIWVADHDTNRVKLAALCQFALAPTPVIYYGTEIGIPQQYPSSDHAHGGDAQVRTNMIWDESKWDRDLFDFYGRLIQVRKTQPALSAGTRRDIHLDPVAQTWAFVRELGDDAVVAAFNLGDEPATVNLGESGLGKLELLVATGSEVTAPTPASLHLGGMTAGLFKRPQTLTAYRG